MRYDYITPDGKTISQDAAPCVIEIPVRDQFDSLRHQLEDAHRLLDLLRADNRSLDLQLLAANRIIEESNHKFAALHKEMQEWIERYEIEQQIAERALKAAIRMI